MRPAAQGDARFLAWTMQEADRMGGRVGSLDLIFDGSEAERLALLARLATSAHDSIYHYSRFLVAEVDGNRAAALAGYVPEQLSADSAAVAVEAEGAALGWPRSKITAAIDALDLYRSGRFFQVPIPADTLRVEWVATRPEHRGRGLNRALHEALFARARDRGHTTAHVGTAVGNQAAIAAYESVGFEWFAECRHVDFEALFGHPGLVFLRRNL